MSTKPEWVTRLEAQPCECVSCGECGGTGTVYYEMDGTYIGLRPIDDMCDSEACDSCRGGIVEQCERCGELDKYEASLEERR